MEIANNVTCPHPDRDGNHGNHQPAHGRARNPARELARDLAGRLGMPLLSHSAAVEALSPSAAQPVYGAAEMARLLVAIAADSGGAVLELAASLRQAADLSVLPGKVVDVDGDDVAQDEAGLERLVRRIRQSTDAAQA